MSVGLAMMFCLLGPIQTQSPNLIEVSGPPPRPLNHMLPAWDDTNLQILASGLDKRRLEIANKGFAQIVLLDRLFISSNAENVQSDQNKAIDELTKARNQLEDLKHTLDLEILDNSKRFSKNDFRKLISLRYDIERNHFELATNVTTSRKIISIERVGRLSPARP